MTFNIAVRSKIEIRFYREYLNLRMKIRQPLTVTSPKHSKKNINPAQLNAPFSATSPNRHNSAINLKLAKEKSKAKKQNKDKKNDTRLEGKKTKRKQKKKPTSELNSTILFKESIDSRQSRKEDSTVTKLKSRTTEKYCRLSSKPELKNSSNCDWLTNLMQGSTVTDCLKEKKRKSAKKEQTKFTLPNEEYLFIGEDFYHVDKLCPTKRILNTFRDVCSDFNSTEKFVAQDKNDKPVKLDIKKSNIFSEARRQIELKSKEAKAVKIQRWWKNIMKGRVSQVRANPEQQLQDEFYAAHEQKVNFEEESIEQLRSPFEIEQLNQSPILSKNANQDSIIASFNSIESLEEHPKKIMLSKENLNNLLNHEYKLPEQHEVNSQENEQIFSNYYQFKQKQDEKVQKTKKDEEEVVFRSGNETTLSPPMDLFKELQQANRVKEMIQMRIIQQKGHMRLPDSYHSRVAISTNILSIHSFLIKFFNFYIQHHRDEFINLINMPYGHSIDARIRHLHGLPLPVEEEQEDDEGIIYGLTKIIDQSKISQFYDYLQSKESNKSSVFNANLQLERIHSQAVLDYFNQQLNSYRPYKEINGVPYPWNNTYKALTFYFVTEENIAQIFQKTEIAILKSCSMLTGIHLPYPQPIPVQSNPFEFNLTEWMEQYESKSHGMILQYNEDKEVKQIHQDIKKQVFEADSQIFTGLLMELSKEVFNQLAAELVLDMANLDMY